MKKANILVCQAVPSMFFKILQSCVQLVNLYFLTKCAEADDALIAGFGMANFLATFTFIGLAMGLNGALETLVSQAYGQKNLELCSINLYRSRIVLTALFMISCCILFQTASILQFLGQDAKAAEFA